MNLQSFDLNLLRVLDALLEEGSTVRAGQRIGLSQPAVSSALGRLRGALGDPLFIRSGSGLEPTDFARRIAPDVRALLEKIEQTLTVPNFDPALSRDVFRLSGTDFFAELMMPRLADRLSHEAPGVKTILVDLVTEAYIESIETHGVDIALMPKIGDIPERFHWRPFAWASFVFVARKGHPRLARAGVQPGEVVPLDLFCDLGHIVMSPEGRLETLSDETLRAMGRDRRVVMSMPYFSSIYHAVSESDLVALLPTKLAEQVADRVGLVIYRPPIKVTFVLLIMVWKATSASNPAHRWFRETAFQELAWLNEGEPALPSGYEG
jgi:DNA-binding transcriptional LysR family regulator